MAKVNAEQFADKHSSRLSGATEDIRRGVMNVTVSPTRKAAEKLDKMKANFNKAIDSGKVKRGLLRVDLPEWQQKMLEKGISRIPEGIQAARGKMIAFGEQLLAYEDGLQTKIKAMPDTTLEDSINRMTSWARGMAKFERK